jgi:(2R)-3-sulfolactate dehydrogenase (NADP+)
MALIKSDDLRTLVARALTHAGATSVAATSTARALVAADEQGIATHGASRTPHYVGHLRNARVIGDAVPRVAHERGGACLIDAGNGLAYPACEMAVTELTKRAKQFGVAYVGITNSNHNGMTSFHLEPLAKAGLVALAFCNSPAAMNAWGGKRPIFGTNPIAAAFPRRGHWPVVVDLALTEVAKGKLMMAARDNKPIPLGWALDRDGNPTTDANEGIHGSLVPAGGAKGAMLALMIELLAVSLTGAAFGFEMDSFFSATGNTPRLGQGFLAIDPGAMAGNQIYGDRVEALVAAMLEDDGVRLPGYRRFENHEKAQRDGIDLPDAIIAELTALAA